MKALIDIGHPAHVHFFRNPVRILTEAGHQVVVTSRDKEMALELLDQFGVSHEPLSRHAGGGILSLAAELWRRDRALLKVVRRERPDIMAAIGGTFIAHVGRWTRIPSLAFYDTENATLQNAITYPLASRVLVPRCYNGWVPKKKEIRYDGYHELSYLHPKWFAPNRSIAESNGLDLDRPTFLIRIVAWKANHDIGERGWTPDLLHSVANKLSSTGKVLISAEGALPETLEPLRYTGRSSEIHHIMAFCRMFVGESATMASECAVLGVPAIYAAHTGRGYTDEQESRYGLATNLRDLDWSVMEKTIDELLSTPDEEFKQRRQRLLSETVDVAPWVAGCISGYPDLPDGERVGRS